MKVGRRHLAVDLGQDAGEEAPSGQSGPEPVGVIASIGEQGLRRRQGIDHERRVLVIAHLIFVDQHDQRPAMAIRME